MSKVKEHDKWETTKADTDNVLALRIKIKKDLPT